MPNFTTDKLAAAEWARDVLADGTALILDSETSGLGSDARICQLAVIDLQGNKLLDTFVNPQIKIPEEAIAIHGITDEMVKDAPTLDEVMYPSLVNIFDGFRKQAIIYNAEFDTRILRQHIKSIMPDVEYSIFYACAMKEYAKFIGDWNDYHKSYKWQRLPAVNGYQAHSALGDCFATLALIKQMAAFAEYQTVDDIPF